MKLDDEEREAMLSEQRDVKRKLETSDHIGPKLREQIARRLEELDQYVGAPDEMPRPRER